MVVDLPNIICGEEVTSEDTKTLTTFHDMPKALIYGATDAQLRRAKRSLHAVRKQLLYTPHQDLVDWLGRAMHVYFADDAKLKLLSELTGSPLSYLRSSIGDIRTWAANIDTFLHHAFGAVAFDKTPYSRVTHIRSHKIHVPKGPCVVVLPKNEEIVACYVIAQLILARTPALIKMSSSGGSVLCGIELLRALKQTATSQLQPFVQAYSVVNLFSEDKDDIMRRLHIHDGVYVLFGSNTTIDRVKQTLNTLGPYKECITMGTGFSTSVVLDDGKLAHAAQEVTFAAAMDRGNKCTSTTVCYVQEAVYDTFLLKLKRAAETYVAGSPVDPTVTLGNVATEDCQSMDAYLKSHGVTLDDVGRRLHVVELSAAAVVQEVPGPLLVVKRISDEHQAIRCLQHDLSQHNIEKNLVTSVFTSSAERLHAFLHDCPSHTIRHNIATTRLNLYTEHQGTYLIRNLVRAKLFEQPLPEDLNIDQRTALVKEVSDGTGSRPD